MIILVGKHSGNALVSNDTFYYRFFLMENGQMEKVNLKQKSNQSTKDVYINILTHFLEKKLISVIYDTMKIKEEYLGLQLENNKTEKLSIYFTSNALDAFTSLEKIIEHLKCQDYYSYAIKHIQKNVVELFSIRSSSQERSSIFYISDNLEYGYFHKQKQLEYYYRKTKEGIDEWDLWTLFSIIRAFINQNVEYSPSYVYKNVHHYESHLLIQCNKKACIEIMERDLIKEIEKSRILDDLWLLQNRIISKMPLQYESMCRKKELKRKKAEYLERKN